MKVFLMVADAQDNTKQWPVGNSWYAPISEFRDGAINALEDLKFGDVVIDNVTQEIHINAWMEFD